ncbi:MAG: methyltransferase domain-containing protein [Pyrinomonadaceae bacterium]
MPKENVLPLSSENAFRRTDESADDNFYLLPRFVTHIDDGAILAVTNLYREFFPPGGEILDLMSSWVSHLPEEVKYSRVTGLGMNAAELASNPRLTNQIVQNLNAQTTLPFGDNEFDAAAICVSVQYLIQPITIFSELARVLKKDAPLVVTFSNRCFPTKAVFAWNALDDENHIALVREYFVVSEGFSEPEIRLHEPLWGDPLLAVIGRAEK